MKPYSEQLKRGCPQNNWRTSKRELENVGDSKVMTREEMGGGNALKLYALVAEEMFNDLKN